MSMLPSPLIFTHRLHLGAQSSSPMISVPDDDDGSVRPSASSGDVDPTSPLILALTADERTKSRHYFENAHHAVWGQQGVYLRLPRGTVLHHNDRLTSADHAMVLRVIAKPEPVMTAIATTPLALLKAAYHLGNRHVPLEVQISHLRFAPDPVLRQMVEQMGLEVVEETVAFHPESGAYGGGHSHHHHS